MNHCKHKYDRKLTRVFSTDMAETQKVVAKLISKFQYILFDMSAGQHSPPLVPFCTQKQLLIATQLHRRFRQSCQTCFIVFWRLPFQIWHFLAIILKQ